MRIQLKSIKECDGKTLCDENAVIIPGYSNYLSINFNDNTSLVIRAGTDYDGGTEIDDDITRINADDYRGVELGLFTQSELDTAWNASKEKAKAKREKQDKEDYIRLKAQFEGTP